MLNGLFRKRINIGYYINKADPLIMFKISKKTTDGAV